MGEEPQSLWAIIAAAGEKRRAESPTRPRRHPEAEPSQFDPASGWIEDADFNTDHRDAPETREDQDRRRPTYSRQVCIRLSSGQFEELGHAADLYGVAPGTMARLLVRRGSRAVLEHHRRYDLEQDMAD